MGSVKNGDFQRFFADFDPVIFCLQEIKLQKKNIDKVVANVPNGYAQYWNTCTTRAGYAGSAILTKVKPLNVKFDFGNKHVGEGRTITMEFSRFILVNAYVPNSMDDLSRIDYRIEEWDADFQNYLKELELEHNKPVILAGDLNVAHMNIDKYDNREENVPSFMPVEKESFQRMLDKGFIDVFRGLYPNKAQYSCWGTPRHRSLNQGSRLDYFLVSQDYESAFKLKIDDCKIHDYWPGSDHAPISLHLDLTLTQRNSKENKLNLDSESDSDN